MSQCKQMQAIDIQIQISSTFSDSLQHNTVSHIIRKYSTNFYVGMSLGFEMVNCT